MKLFERSAAVRYGVVTSHHLPAARFKRLRTRVTTHQTAAAAALTSVAVGILAGREFLYNGADVGDWDLLFFSGCLTVIAGLWLARGQAQRFDAMLERLANRGALERAGRAVSRDDLAVVECAICIRGGKWARWSGQGLSVVIFVAFIVVKTTRSGDFRLVYVSGALVGGVSGFLVGRVIGHTLSYGLLGRSLAREHITFRATPGHIDRAAGLKPLGDYYLYQALLLAVPAAFLVAWSLVLLIPAWDERYKGWRAWYLGLLAVAICLELAAFVAPLWRAHQAMKRQKRDALVEADTALSPEIARARKELEHDLDRDRRAAVRDWLEQLTSSYLEIETMPTWPVDGTLRRRVTLGNMVLIVPLVTQLAALAGRS